MKTHFGILVCLLVSSSAHCQWQRHTVDDLGRGADGVRIEDVDGDGLDDIVTGWEESGHICLYVQPTLEKIREPWPRVVVGKSPSVEDAFAIDLDQDGIKEIISCHEGKTHQVLIHRLRIATAPASRSDLLQAKNWQSVGIASCQGVSRWMFATGLRRGTDKEQGKVLAVGSKDPQGQVSLLLPPADGVDDLTQWRRIQLQPAGWIMSLVALDMDLDGDEDLVVSDRKGSDRGVYWLEQPDDAEAFSVAERWVRHEVGGHESEVMFLDARPDAIVAATRGDGILRWARSPKGSADGEGTWQRSRTAAPFGIVNGKAVRRMEHHGQPWFVFTANRGVDRSDHGKPAVSLFSFEPSLQPIDIGGDAGVKFDRIEVRDLDQDGDLDILTCEERDNLGVFWYENPG
ncbi:FG-GAP repeat domain-containing protein [Novipirellula artificiosorum]|uniref:FG-GAP repeat protein n=1 Tax=Novipirellula artificiosorum TaxID=2528016 RepID=A0A5C6D5B1_9BACT|nr:VCBS repeat-containing protein [Novipirellula artificiosorum]TWU31988.1 hypothetical protein Poly41_58760 [Novipirellula artificiosorum]